MFARRKEERKRTARRGLREWPWSCRPVGFARRGSCWEGGTRRASGRCGERWRRRVQELRLRGRRLRRLCESQGQRAEDGRAANRTNPSLLPPVVQGIFVEEGCRVERSLEEVSGVSWRGRERARASRNVLFRFSRSSLCVSKSSACFAFTNASDSVLANASCCTSTNKAGQLPFSFAAPVSPS